MLKRVWENRKNILQGIINALFASKDIKLMAKARRVICDECPYSSKNTQDRPDGNLPYEHCTKCGCMLLLKTHSQDSECPVGKW